MTDADYTNDLALLANTPTQAESLLYNLEKAAGGIGSMWMHIKQGICVLKRKEPSPL